MEDYTREWRGGVVFVREFSWGGELREGLCSLMQLCGEMGEVAEAGGGGGLRPGP